MSDAAGTPIERWWPHLDIKYKHEILEDLDAPLSSPTLDAVSRLSGDEATAVRSIHLSESEKSYIRTQVEAVD